MVLVRTSRDPWTGDVMNALLNVASSHRSDPAKVHNLAAMATRIRSLASMGEDAARVVTEINWTLAWDTSGELYRTLLQSTGLPNEHPARIALEKILAASPYLKEAPKQTRPTPKPSPRNR